MIPLFLELRECLESESLDFDKLEQIVSRFNKWNLELNKQIPYDRIISDLINKNLNKLANGTIGLEVLEQLNKGMRILKQFKLDPNLHISQNLYFQMASKDEIGALDPKMKAEFDRLGKNLGIKIQ